MPRKGRPVTGWLNLDKPAGVTSTAAVAKVRWALGAKKAGHAGTLDPDATGVLVVALGEATKAVPVVQDSEKHYRFRVVWGAETTTDDAAGEVTATSDARPTPEALAAALAGFRGDILQTPPQVSAVKVDGERAYDLAREGVAMDLAARPLHVARLEVADPDGPVLEMVCGKGGYVRAIARDLGRALGTCAHVGWLRRLAVGPFDAEDAVAWERVEAAAKSPELDALLVPLEAGLRDLPECRLSAAGALRARNGNPAEVTQSAAQPGDRAWGSHGGRAVALGTYLGGQLHPDRVFVA